MNGSIVGPGTAQRAAGRRSVDVHRGHQRHHRPRRRRRVPAGAVRGDGPQHPGRLPGRRAARGGPARRVQRRTRREQLGHRGQRDEHPRRQGCLGGRPRQRSLQHVHQLGAGRQQAVGDLPGDRAAELAGCQPGPGARRARHRGGRPGRLRRDGDGHVPSRALPLRRLAVGFPDAVADSDERRHHRRLGPLRRRGHPQHVGSATAGPVEVARPRRAHPAADQQQHPAVGVQPGHADLQRPGGDDRLLRSGRG